LSFQINAIDGWMLFRSAGSFALVRDRLNVAGYDPAFQNRYG
jgi:hypothetical protein